ncbi:MAG: prephenate dehydratase domain-containing protein [Lentilactobacillus hilgardii]|jgi:prephenate dehydratase|uniref:Prephenate dehydratase n=1 Tax=Lentilactobacillus hilgardii TaxID=1588 RepID=A0A6P1E2U0_LENHI|nr:prephenate dehydratase domain-containing protein [Lentilactobacillus hilgardii]MCI2018057.1 prephenate dehydratase [Lentilactobacillus buchneri]RRG11502.1 MAG: prephenate dehydratase [Lactobacillus sp.]EEI72552.1 prephenate dehydratase [Lentilactobacillus hilgardii ATCC 27305]MBZ2202056.1 prephenate dehydratase [Lentilactobacillus hilgardii]MBZ2204860.1 prephenate dehydratase [Lentilactobacillus hilgardii]
MKLSVLGPEGTFADAAAKAYLKTQPYTNVIFDYHPTFDQVYQAVTGENIGLLPLENQLDGYVSATLQRLQIADVTEIGEMTIPVNFGLVANADSLTHIKRLYVQFKTEGQCQKLLSRMPGIQIITTSSNMISLEKFLSGEKGDAAIIPQSQMADQSAPFMLENVADQDDNSTRFIIFKAKPAKLDDLSRLTLTTNHFKAPLFIRPSSNDKPGTLYDILGYFAKADLNLITLMSLPTKTQLGEYSFYIEVSGTRDQQEVIFATLRDMASKYNVHLLGFYAD